MLSALLHYVAEGIVKQNDVENNYHRGACISDNIHPERIPVFAHNLLLVHQHEHKNQDHRKKQAVYNLAEPHHLNEGKIGYEDNLGTHNNDDGKDRVKLGGFFESLPGPCLPAHSLADVVGCSKRQDAGRKERCICKAYGKQYVCIFPC